MDNDIINTAIDISLVDHDIHRSLESFTSILFSELHEFKLVSPKLIYEIRLILASFIHFDSRIAWNKSILLKMLLLVKTSKICSTLGTGHLSFFMIALNLRGSMQNLGLPYFFIGNIVEEFQDYLTSEGISAFIIRSTPLFKILFYAGGSHHKLCEIVLLTSI